MPADQSVLRAAVEYPARRVARRLRGRQWRRTPSTVLDEYGDVYDAFFEKYRAEAWPVEEFVYRHYNPLARRDAREEALAALTETVASCDPKTVLEVGSGIGRNVIHLCHELGIAGTGMELAPGGVKMGNLAAERYGLDATFVEGDITTEWELPPADVVFSVAALEQVHNPAEVIDRMRGHAHKGVVLIEPFPDFWHGLQGFASRQRSAHLDLLQSGALAGQQVTRARTLQRGDALAMPTVVELATQ